MIQTKKTRLWMPTLMLLIQGVSHGADSTTEPQVNETDTLLFQDIPSVYSASKYEQKVTKAPASISIVTADEIKKYGYRTFANILSSLRGFYTTNDRNYGYVGARGFGIPSDYNSRILLMIDGHRFNDNIYDSFDITEAFPIDIDVIERVEVVRGPSSSLYGNSAFFGVINVITKRGREQRGANIKASYGTNDSYKTNISYGNRFSNGIETFLTGSFYNSDGNNALYIKEYDTPSTNNGIYSHNDQEQAKKLHATMSYHDFSVQGLYTRSNKNLPTSSFGTEFNSPLTKTMDESAFLELKYDHTFKNQLNIQSRVSYNQYRYAGDFAFDYASDFQVPAPFIVVNKDVAIGKWWRAELEATKVLWNDHRLTVGGQYQGNMKQMQTNYDLETYLLADFSSYQWAVFFQDDYSITKNITLNAGVRFDYFSTFGATTNPRLALIYTPWDSTTVKLLYGTAFRAPNQYELHYKQNDHFLKSEGLKPEKLQASELILEHYFNNHLRAEVNLFHTDIRNLIAATLMANGFQQNKNTNALESSGVEAQLEDSWGEGFQWRASYTWQNTINKQTLQRVVNSPEHLLKLNVIAPLWHDNVFVGFETQYMSSRATTLGGKVSDHVINNITVFTQNWIKGVEFSSGIYNLFNQRYFDSGSSAHIQNGIQQDGLTFRIKGSVDF